MGKYFMYGDIYFTMGMCCCMGSHFHDWIDYDGVPFSIELLEWGPIFSVFWGKTVLHISS